MAGNVEHKRDERYKWVTKQLSGLESIGAELGAGEDWWIRAMWAARTDLPQRSHSLSTVDLALGAGTVPVPLPPSYRLWPWEAERPLAMDFMWAAHFKETLSLPLLHTWPVPGNSLRAVFSDEGRYFKIISTKIQAQLTNTPMLQLLSSTLSRQKVGVI